METDAGWLGADGETVFGVALLPKGWRERTLFEGLPEPDEHGTRISRLFSLELSTPVLPLARMVGHSLYAPWFCTAVCWFLHCTFPTVSRLPAHHFVRHPSLTLHLCSLHTHVWAAGRFWGAVPHKGVEYFVYMTAAERAERGKREAEEARRRRAAAVAKV